MITPNPSQWPDGMTKPPIPCFDDGLIEFTLRSENGESLHQVDSLIAATVADELVRQHSLEIAGDTYVFTTDFLDALVKAFVERFKLPTITSDIALRIWLAAQHDVYGVCASGANGQ